MAGRRILDAGCGSGPLFAALRDRGALVTGFDQSAGMLELARRRLGADADLRVADLADPLPFPDGAFDDVVASLVLHYLKDWESPLAELRRVLRPGGRLIASVNHPMMVNLTHRQDGPRNRPLHAMTDAFTEAGFRITAISEPHPVPEARELFPDDFAVLDTFPTFLFFVLEA